MVRVTGPCYSLTASGWLGKDFYHRTGVCRNPYPIGIRNPYLMTSQYYSPVGWHYCRRRTWHGIVWIATKPWIPANPQTTEQQHTRFAFYKAVAEWQKLTSEQKAVYNTWRYPVHASGYNRFISWYLKNLPGVLIYWGDLQRSAVDPALIEEVYLPLAGGILTGDVVPNTDNSIELGLAAKGWKEIYINTTGNNSISPLSSLGCISDGALHYFNNYPATANADDDEFLTNNIGTWAGGNFWEWINSPTGTPTVALSRLNVQCKGNLANDPKLKGNISALTYSDLFKFHIHTILMRDTNEEFKMGFEDVSEGKYVEIGVRNDGAGSMLVETIFEKGAGPVSSTISLGTFSPDLWLRIGISDEINHDYFCAFTTGGPDGTYGGLGGSQEMGAAFVPDYVYFRWAKHSNAAASIYYMLDFFRRE